MTATMTGMDIDRGADLVATLRQSAASALTTGELVAEAQQLAQLPVPASLMLDDLEREYRALATSIERASDLLTDFAIDLEVAMSPLSSASADRSWNEVRQDASHNSYAVSGGMAGLYDAGIRTFELDIHRGAPTEFLGPGSLRIRPLAAIVADHFDHDGGLPDDWRVYHVTGGATSEYEYLSDGLEAVAALPHAEPITIFIDNKDRFGGTHTAAELDRLVRDALGDRLFRPADLLDRAPAAVSLRQVVIDHGWPTVGELTGKVLVVLTDELDGYVSSESAMFIAPRPEFGGTHEQPTLVSQDHAVFFNAPARSLSRAELAALQVTKSVVRTYVHPRCGSDPAANYRVIDVTSTSPPCSVSND